MEIEFSSKLTDPSGEAGFADRHKLVLFGIFILAALKN